MNRAHPETPAPHTRCSRRHLARSLAAAALSVLTAGCGSPAPAARTRDAPVVTVVTGLWPLQQAAEEIGQGNVKVLDVVPAGEDPLTYHLDAAQRAEVRSAGLVLEMSRSLQPSLATAAAGAAHVADLATAAGGPGSYAWLNPYAMERVARAIASALERVDPAARPTFANGRSDEISLLDSLDADYQGTLGQCPRHTLVASDAAFSVLDSRYPITVVPIDGSTPAPLRPSPATVAREVALVRRLGVKEIYRDIWQPPDGLLEVQAETGVRLGRLDPLTGVPPGGWPKGLKSYFSLMEHDLQDLADALGCYAPGEGGG